MSLAAGDKLGPFEIVGKLGAGGMGEVYRARDSKLKREVAIKVLPADVATDRERLARFQREAEVLASLNHPNIAHVYGIEGDALVMELVEGEDLSQRIARGPVPIDEALLIARQIAEALEAAHDAGIIHRDLKPANIKVRNDGTVKVLDFGLAKSVVQDLKASGPHDVVNSPTITSPAMTMHGVILGTAAYMSPEQAKGKAVDKRADIWAFGCVLYEMLTGTRAFKGDDVTDIITSVMRDAPDWDALPVATPPSIRTLLRRCIEKDPRKRAPHISIARLEIDEATVSNGEPLRGVPVSRSGATWRERTAWAIAVVAAVGAMVLAFTRPSPVPPPAPVQFSMLPVGDTARFLRGPGSYALSPDGQSLVYSAQSASGAAELWLHTFRNGSARRLPNTISAILPFWSPDGRALAFQANGKLHRLDVASGAVQTICDCRGGQGSWNRDDVILFAIFASGIHRVSANGGTPEVVTRLDTSAGEIRHVRPQFLPDGKRFLYGAVTTDPGKSTLRLGDTSSAETRSIGAIPLGAEFIAPGYLVYATDGPLLARPFDEKTATFTGEPIVISDTVRQQALGLASFSTSPGGMLVYDPTNLSGDMELVWLGRDGSPSGVFATVNGVHSMALAANDQLAAVEMLTGGRAAGLWVLDAVRGTRTRLTFDAEAGLAQGHPAWSPDLTQLLYFVGQPGAKTTLMIKDTAGTAAAQHLLPGDPNTVTRQPTDWSADGRLVIFEETTTANNWDLRYVRLDDRRPVNILNSPFSERQGQLSPDGRHLAYVSSESGQMEIHVIEFPGASQRWTISSRGGTSPRWSRDGRELLFLDLQGMLMRVAIPPGASFRPGVPTPLFDPGAVSTDAWNYAIGRDGRVLVVRPIQKDGPGTLNVVLNLPQLLTRSPQSK